VVHEVTILHTVYTIDPKKRVTKTSFSKRNLRGLKMMESVIFFRGGVYALSVHLLVAKTSRSGVDE